MACDAAYCRNTESMLYCPLRTKLFHHPLAALLSRKTLMIDLCTVPCCWGTGGETPKQWAPLPLQLNCIWHYPKQNVCFGCFASIPKHRVSMFRLNQKKQKTNRNSLIGSIFCYFFTEKLEFFSFFLIFSLLFSFFGFFRFVSKQFVSVVLFLYQNREFRCFDWTETNRRPTLTD